MVASESAKSKRLNVMVSEALIERASKTAQSRGVSLSALVRQSLEAELHRTLENQISQVAEDLAELYESDDQLTEFTVLDGDDFL